MRSLSRLIRFACRPALRSLALLALATLAGTALAQSKVAQAAGRDFDHLRTGFALTGSHASQRCESCHVGGVFKGTPRDCASCHTTGARFARGNVTKTADHVPTQLGCESCHNAGTFVGARFNHTGIRPGSCASCHNSTTASGKSPGHVATTAACDSCHRNSTSRQADDSRLEFR